MNTTLTRQQFLERSFEPADFGRMAVMLADWRRQCETRPLAASTVDVRVEIRLWGFPRAEGSTYRDYVESQARQRGISGLEVSLLDPDTLSVQLEALPIKVGTGKAWRWGQPAVVHQGVVVSARDLKTSVLTEAPPGAAIAEQGAEIAAILQMIVEDELFANLLCETRYTLKAPGGDHSVVCSGIIGNGVVRLHALWPAGLWEFDETTYAKTCWPLEKHLLQAFDRYRSGVRRKPEWVRGHLYCGPSLRNVGRFLKWFLQPPNNRPLPFAVRCAVSLALIVLCAAGMHARPALSVTLLAGVFLGAAGLFYTIWVKVRRLTNFHRTMHRSMRAMYSQAQSLVTVDLARVVGALEDVALRKYTTDIEALGGVHHRDIVMEPPPLTGSFHTRLFYFPEDDTVFILALLYRTASFIVKPAKPVFMTRTRFTDGSRLTCSSDTGGYLKEVLPGAFFRKLENVPGPEEMLRKHRHEIQWIEAAGHTRKPLLPAEIVSDMGADHEELRAAKARYGYFRWSDAFYMAFNLTRRENRSSGQSPSPNTPL